jgi:hypothetical protein
MRAGRSLLVISIVAALTILGAVPSAQAQPPNDDFANATVVTEPLPFMDSADTTDATVEPTDPEPSCVSTTHTVWYSYTPSADTRIELNTFGSDYDTTLSAWLGEPGNLAEVACNDDTFDSLQSRIRFDVTSGVTYFVMAGSFFDSPGGNLELTVDVAPPPILEDLTIDPTGSVKPKTGTAMIHGTVTCSEAGGTVFLDGSLSQRVGRFRVFGFGFTDIECSGETPYSLTIIPENGLFAGGPATAQVFAFTEEEFLEASREIRLRGR